jgi:TatD DNase family protein
MIDTHCHLTHPKLAGEVDAVLARARDAGAAACISIGTGPDDARRARALADRHPGFVFCSAGIDPFTSHDRSDRFDEEFGALDSLLREGGFVAVGEIGLDYHYDLDPKNVQAERFERQRALAIDLGLPVVIHVREAHDDLAALLSGGEAGHGVVHSFTAGPREAERYLELGWHLGFNGVVTFRNAEDVRRAAAMVPEDRILLETDSPYLAPVPMRGKRCEPAWLVHTLECLAEVRGCDVEHLREVTTASARRLFGLEGCGA